MHRAGQLPRDPGLFDDISWIKVHYNALIEKNPPNIDHKTHQLSYVPSLVDRHDLRLRPAAMCVNQREHSRLILSIDPGYA